MFPHTRAHMHTHTPAHIGYLLGLCQQELPLFRKSKPSPFSQAHSPSSSPSPAPVLTFCFRSFLSSYPSSISTLISVHIHLSQLCLFLSKMSPANALNLIPLSSPRANPLVSLIFPVYHGFINCLTLNSQPKPCPELPIQISNWQWTSPTTL